MNTSIQTSQKFPKLIFLLSLVIPAYWFLVNSFDIYKWAVLGAIHELLAIPLLIGMIILPIVTIVLCIKNKFQNNLLNIALAIFLLTIPTFFFLFN